MMFSATPRRVTRPDVESGRACRFGTVGGASSHLYFLGGSISTPGILYPDESLGRPASFPPPVPLPCILSPVIPSVS